MNNNQIESMTQIVIQNLHLLDYTVVNMDKKTTILQHKGKLLYIPTTKFMSIFQVNISFIKFMLNKLAEQAIHTVWDDIAGADIAGADIISAP